MKQTGIVLIMGIISAHYVQAPPGAIWSASIRNSRVQPGTPLCICSILLKARPRKALSIMTNLRVKRAMSRKKSSWLAQTPEPAFNGARSLVQPTLYTATGGGSAEFQAGVFPSPI